MKTTKISSPYAGNANKANGQTLSASEWNALSAAARDAQTAVNSIFADTVVLTNASQATAENKVYSVQSSIDLNGGTLTMPAGCTLLFEGGSISNGSLVLNNTRIEGEASFSNVTISGSCANEVLTPQMFGAMGDDVTDDTKAFQSLAAVANNRGAGKVFIPAKTYLVTGVVQFEGNFEICGTGKGSRLHFTGGGGLKIGSSATGSNSNILATYLTGADTTKTLTDGNGNTCTAAAKGATILEVSDASVFEVDGWYIIKDTVDYSFDSSRAYYRQGEFVKVKKIDTENNTITLYNAIYGQYGTDENFGGYAAATGEFEQAFTTSISGQGTHRTVFVKPVLHKVSVHDFSIFAEGNSAQVSDNYYGLFVSGIENSQIFGLDINNNGCNHVAVYVGIAVDSVVKDCVMRSYYDGVDAYACTFGSIQGMLISGCTAGSRNHAITSGGNPNVDGIVNRNNIFERLRFVPMTADNEDGTVNRSQIALDSHAGSELYIYRDIDAPTYSCDLGGYYGVIENCKFYVVSNTFHGSGFTVRNSEIVLDFYGQVWHNNPWHDYSEDIETIEGCTIGHNITFNAQSNINNFKPKTLVIRNCFIGDTVYMRYKVAERIDIDGNTMQFLYIRDRSNEPTVYNIRNNIIESELTDDCGLMIEVKSAQTDPHPGDKIYIIGNSIITPNNTTNYPVYFGWGEAVVSNNYIKNGHWRGVILPLGKATIANNILVSTNNNPSVGVGYNKPITVADNNQVEGTTKYNYYIIPTTKEDNGTTYTFDAAIGDMIEVHLPGGPTKYRPQRPANGERYYDTTLRAHISYNSSTDRWEYDDGTRAVIRRGNTAARPVAVAVGYAGTERPAAANAFIGQVFKRTGQDDEYYIAASIGNSVTWIPERIFAGKTIDDSIPRRGTNIWAFTGKMSDIYLGFLFWSNNALHYYKAVGSDAEDNVVWEMIDSDKLTRGIDTNYAYFDTELQKNVYAEDISYDGPVTWKEEDGVLAGTKRSGTFTEKPNPAIAVNGIYVGFRYFCTDRQTTEGQADGIEIIWNGTAWVDALGRTVS